MRPSETHSGPYGPRPAYSLRRTLAGTALAAAMLVVAVLAVSYPVAAATALVAAVAAWGGVRQLDRLRQARRRGGQSRRVCVPATDVCVEA